MISSPVLRAGRDADAAGFIALMSACWLEYPGCVVDIDGEAPELHALASYFAKCGGTLWAAEQNGQVVGMIGTRPLADGAWELCKVYAYPDQRGTGLAQALVDAADAHARAHGATEMKLWSDTRFDRAHRFYEKLGYVRAGAIRVLDDLSHSLEFGYARPLTGSVVRSLDAAAAASAVPGLRRLGLGMDAVWRAVATDVALGKCAMLVVWVDGAIGGAAVLDFPVPHRAEVRILQTQAGSDAGAALLHEAGRRTSALLTARVRMGAAESLYRAAGWCEAGRVPGHDRAEDDTPQDVIWFYRAAA